MSLPLTALFVDCDSFFASCEQHLNPELQGLPIGIAPVMAETSCCIAASYEAKAFGVKTGTGVREARVMCPGIQIVEARPAEYVKIHHRVVAAVEDCIHVEAVLSIDEMWAWLPYNWRDREFVIELGQRVKEAVMREIGPAVKVSVGAGPNKFLAKLASKMRKPDGLFVIEEADLPEILHELKLSDITGIGRSMETRLHAAGLHTVEALCAAPKPVIHGVWGSVLGDRLYHLLRGEVIPDLVTARKSIGHGHVLPPDCRHPDAAWPILCKLTHKACERLRSHGLMTGSVTMQLAYMGGPSWNSEIQFPESDATLQIMGQLTRLWRDRPDPRSKLIQVGVVLSKFSERSQHTPDLFQSSLGDEDKHQRLDAALDKLRARYGRSVVFMGSVQEHRDSAPMRISFTHIPELGLEGD